ncbi:TlpA family protein disulfide reductase [Candidatus Calescamantes bacterium]|nr:TlpA family protein disulfide reductase [Candidatus Calescamantes bacterium]
MAFILLFFIVSQNPERDSILAPSFYLKTLDGDDFFLSDYFEEDSSGVLILDFFTTWCKPCLKEIKELRKMLEDSTYRDKVDVILINVGEPPMRVARWALKNEIDLSILIDKFEKVRKSYGVKAIPSVFVIKNLKIKLKITGYHKDSIERIKNVISITGKKE